MTEVLDQFPVSQLIETNTLIYFLVKKIKSTSINHVNIFTA